MSKDCQEFYLLWLEQRERWMFVLEDGYTSQGFPSQGAALQAALQHIGRAEAEYFYENHAGNIHALKDDEFWGKV